MMHLPPSARAPLFGAKYGYDNRTGWNFRYTGDRKALNSLPDDPVLKHALDNTSDEINLSFRSRTPRHPLYSAAITTESSRYLNTVDFSDHDLYDPDLPGLVYKLSSALIQADQYLARTQKAPETAPAAAESQPENAPDRGLNRVAGMHKLKEILREDVIWPLRNPQQAREEDVSIPRGILLVGPPGCGKTYIVEALAEELNYHFVKLSPSKVGTKWLHETAGNLKQVFEEAKKKAPAVIFIDEAESIAPDRAQVNHDARVEEVNEVLNQINDAHKHGILVVMATNRPELMDPAAIRTGRADKHIYVGPPDALAREEALKMHLGRKKLQPDLDTGIAARATAQLTEGYAQSDLKALVEEAHRIARRAKAPIALEHIEQALDEVLPSVSETVEKEYETFMNRNNRKKAKPPLGFIPQADTGERKSLRELAAAAAASATEGRESNNGDAVAE